MSFRRETLAEGVELWLGDCLEVLPTLGAVDLVLTDPPYELSSAGPGKSHYGMSLRKFDSKAYTDIVAGFDEAIFFPLVEAVCRPLNLFCFCSNKQISKIMSYHETRGRATTLLVWHKVNAAPFANGVWRGDIEYCVHARDAGAVFVGNAEEKKKVSEHPIVNDDAHPTVKPLAIVEKYIRIGSRQGQTVLDPYCGLGTSGVAAVKLGRRFTGIEIDPGYFDIACRRIEAALKQPDMFIPTPEPLKQTSMFSEDAA
jgi:site-specific DNA-methyltransferase (adenine-specific)